MLAVLSSALPITSRPSADTDLLHRIATGDDHALETLYDRHATAVYSLALRIADQPATAEDIVQETFMRVWRAAPAMLDTVHEPAAWLMRIARNLALDSLRRQAVRPQPVAADTSSDLFELVPDADLDPEGAVWLESRGQAVRAALVDLPTEQRQAVELAFFEGLTHREIAARLDLPLGTVKTRLRLGLRKLAASLRAVV